MLRRPGLKPDETNGGITTRHPSPATRYPSYIFNCTLYKFAYAPSNAINSSCVPCSSIP
jgi:hypothetical protein